MCIASVFILLLTCCVTRGDDIHWRSLKKQGQYALRDNPKATFAPKPKLSPRSIPKEFDARRKWPQCREVFEPIRDQGGCGSCWAVAGATLISQIHCIHTNGEIRFRYSAQDILSCAKSPENNGCEGGYMHEALEYWIRHGCPSGGEVGERYGCLPYSKDAYSRNTDVGCQQLCSNSGYSLSYDEDKKVGSSFKHEQLRPSAPIMQHSIMTYGPIMASFNAYEDFSRYNGSNVYQLTEEGESYGHAILLLGWGEQDGVPYWLGQNSWGKNWGDRGYFKFLRGENHLQLEQHSLRLAPRPKNRQRTRRPSNWNYDDFYGRRVVDPEPRGHFISEGKRHNAVVSHLLLFFIFVLSNC